MKTDTKTFAFRCPECGSTTIGQLSVFDLAERVTHIQCAECKDSELVITRTNDSKLRISVPCFACPSPHYYTVSPSVIFSNPIFTLRCSYTGFDIFFIGDKENVFTALDESDELLRTLFEPEFDEAEKELDEDWEDIDDIDGEDFDDDEDYDDDLFGEDGHECHCGHDHGCGCGHDHSHECGCDHNHGHECDCEKDSAIKPFTSYRKASREAEEEAKSSAPRSPREIGDCTDPVIMSEVIYLIHDLAEEDKISCSCGSKKIALALGYDSVVLTCASCGRMKKIPAVSESDRIALEEITQLTI